MHPWRDIFEAKDLLKDWVKLLHFGERCWSRNNLSNSWSGRSLQKRSKNSACGDLSLFHGNFSIFRKEEEEKNWEGQLAFWGENMPNENKKSQPKSVYRQLIVPILCQKSQKWAQTWQICATITYLREWKLLTFDSPRNRSFVSNLLLAGHRILFGHKHNWNMCCLWRHNQR